VRNIANRILFLLSHFKVLAPGLKSYKQLTGARQQS
jgi:hypothetical protein